MGSAELVNEEPVICEVNRRSRLKYSQQVFFKLIKTGVRNAQIVCTKL